MSRKQRIATSVPDVLDLLVLCVESGLGLDASLRLVTEGIRELSPDLAQELAIVNNDLQMGRPRMEALRALDDRTKVEDLRALTNLIIEADTLGTSVADALRKYADGMRIERRQKAQRRAAVLPLKMAAVLVIFFLLPFIIVAVGPIAITFFQEFDKLGEPEGAGSGEPAASAAPTAAPRK